MESEKSIQMLEQLNAGKFCIIGLPLTNTMVSDITVIYLGKDKDGRFNFYDGGGNCGAFKLRKDFILQHNIKIKQIEDKTIDLYEKLNKKEKIKHKESKKSRRKNCKNNKKIYKNSKTKYKSNKKNNKNSSKDNESNYKNYKTSSKNNN